MYKFILISLLVMGQPLFASAQHRGYQFINDKHIVEFPISIVNNLPVLEVTVNNSRTLNFILDTGMQSTLVFSKKYLKGLDFVTGMDIHFAGMGEKRLIKGKVIHNTSLSIASDFVGNGLSMVIMEDNHRLKKEFESLGIHGVIGYELFARFIVEIDYHNKRGSILKHGYFDFNDIYESMPISIVGTKPYVSAEIKLDEHHYSQANLMLDTGSGTTILLDKNFDSLRLESEAVAKGLSGLVAGVPRKMESISMGSLQMANIPILMIDNLQFSKNNRADKRLGTIGGGFFLAYAIAFDYAHNQLYYRRTHPSKEKKVIVKI